MRFSLFSQTSTGRLPEEPSIISVNGDSPLLGHRGSLSGAVRDGFEKRALELGTVETKRSARASSRRPKKKVRGGKKNP